MRNLLILKKEHQKILNIKSKGDKYSMKSFKEYANDDIYAHLEEELEITEQNIKEKKVKR